MVTVEDIFNLSNSKSTFDIPQSQIKRIQKIASKCCSQKGVYTVLTTLLIYKVNHPEQDVRKHQANMTGGFSGRSYDTRYVTPELKRLGFPSMSESGWLTRSLEQPYPYTKDFPGKISGGVKDDFLELLDYVQKNPTHAKEMLLCLFFEVRKIVQQNKVVITPLSNPEELTIDKIIHSLDIHFNYNYGTHNGAKLPVLAFYAIYLSIIKEVRRYSECELAPLSSLTACDLTSKASGDIEIFKDGKNFESVEIKLNKKIDSAIVRVVEEKVYKYNPERYYILSYYGIEDSCIDEIQEIVFNVKHTHGCQIIINGLLPTIKYYLRLISSLEEFVQTYSQLVEGDREIQKIHKEVWDEIMNKVLNK